MVGFLVQHRDRLRPRLRLLAPANAEAGGVRPGGGAAGPHRVVLGLLRDLSVRRHLQRLDGQAVFISLDLQVAVRAWIEPRQVEIDLLFLANFL